MMPVMPVMAIGLFIIEYTFVEYANHITFIYRPVVSFVTKREIQV